MGSNSTVKCGGSMQLFVMRARSHALSLGGGRARAGGPGQPAGATEEHVGTHLQTWRDIAQALATAAGQGCARPAHAAAGGWVSARCVARRALVMTRSERSRRFMRRSAMVSRTYCCAPASSSCSSMRSRQVATTVRTSWQLSRRTVSMPCAAGGARRGGFKGGRGGHARTRIIPPCQVKSTCATWRAPGCTL